MAAGRIQEGMNEFPQSQTVPTKPNSTRGQLRRYDERNWCSVAVGCSPLPRTQNKHGIVVALKKAGAIEYSEHISLHNVLQKSHLELHALKPPKNMIGGSGHIKEANMKHRRR